jgi:charged multivesicular body protein 4
MFKSLFGKKKAPEKPNVAMTIQLLRVKEADLEKRNQQLEAQCRTATQVAIAANRAGQKQKAIICLQKRKLYERQIEVNNAILMRILQQTMALEGTSINVDSVNVIRRGQEALKEKQKELNPDAITDLNEGLIDAMDNQREIEGLLCEPLDDMGDLEAELAALEEPEPVAATSVATTPVAAISVSRYVSSLPAVPVGPVKQSNSSAMERELAALES